VSNKAKHSDDADRMRLKAENRLRERQADAAPSSRTDADTLRLLHELEVHQIELEMQNEELQRTRVEVETALERYTELYDFAPVGYLTLDSGGGIREANMAGAGMLGTVRSTLTNRRFGLFVAPADRTVFDAFLKQVFSSKARERCEVALLIEGRPSFEVELEAIALESGGECRVALTDLTERKRAAEDRLILGKLEATGILASGIAHDFNNLLTAIVLNLDLARIYAPTGGDLTSCLENAQKAALVGQSLTRQLLASAEGGKLIRKATSLPGLIRESVHLGLSGSRVQCSFFLPEDLWAVAADRGQIGEVVRNLAQNAREAMSGAGMLSVQGGNVARLTRDMPALTPGRYVRISIADRGSGIFPKDLPRIFDPYFSTKQRGDQKGMGLGLTICHMIIQKHGGAIAVQSVPGEGSTFEFYLPAEPRPEHGEDVSKQ
jgi:two-component system, cell cycle sensor histidine kinase and response regulator CckA